MLNHRDSQPTLADHGTPVQDYVGPQAEGNLPPWQPAPLIPQQKVGEGLSDEQMAAIRTAAGQEVDAKRAIQVRSNAFILMGVLLLINLFIPSALNFVVPLYLGFAIWSVAYLAFATTNDSTFESFKLKKLIAQNDALLGLPAEQPIFAVTFNPYKQALKRYALMSAGLVITLAVSISLAGQYGIASIFINALIMFTLGIGIGILVDYLTLVVGIGRLNATERQQRIDELLRKWTANI